MLNFPRKIPGPKANFFFFDISNEKESLQTWIITSHYLESMTVDHNNIVTPYSLQVDLAYTMRLKGAPSNFSWDFSLLYNSLTRLAQSQCQFLGNPSWLSIWVYSGMYRKSTGQILIIVWHRFSKCLFCLVTCLQLDATESINCRLQVCSFPRWWPILKVSRINVPKIRQSAPVKIKMI